jgi:hypothetical protein
VIEPLEVVQLPVAAVVDVTKLSPLIGPLFSSLAHATTTRFAAAVPIERLEMVCGFAVPACAAGFAVAVQMPPPPPPEMAVL